MIGWLTAQRLREHSAPPDHPPAGWPA
jgi:hypothetical protein